jgi:UDP-glucose 4-epimerase
MSKYVVTGGCGFIGSHLVRALLERGDEVIVLDDLSTGFLEYLPNHSNLTHIQIDLTHMGKLTKFLPLFQNTEGVFHLAAKARIQPSIQTPHITHDSNVNGIFNLLEFMRMARIKNIVYSASSSSYGRKAELPCREDTLMDCLNPYSLTKYVGELYCKTWGALYGMNSVSLRYFNVYGERSPLSGAYATVIGLFFRQALTNSPMTIVGDGEQRRDFTHVSDVVRANLLAMSKIEEEGVNGETFKPSGEQYFFFYGPH